MNEETFKLIYAQFFPQGGESDTCPSGVFAELGKERVVIAKAKVSFHLDPGDDGALEISVFRGGQEKTLVCQVPLSLWLELVSRLLDWKYASKREWTAAPCRA